MSAPTAHPVLEAVATVQGALASVAEVDPAYMGPECQRLALTGLAAARAQLDELTLRVMAAAAAVADTDAARDVAAWQVAHNHHDIRTAKAEQRLAEALDRRYDAVRSAMTQGRVHLDQAHAIVTALDDLPDDLDTPVRAHAEAVLVELAGQHTPRELHRLGARVLEAAAPDQAEEILARQLQAEEAAARTKTRLTLRQLGDGTTRITATVPTPTAARLKTYLDALTSPRQGQNRGGGPYPRLLGTAFCALLERIDPTQLPQHGGRATTVVVTIALESLKQELGVGDLIGGEALSASQIRRLACTAAILPAVLGGKGQVLDLGRGQRIYTPAQHLALQLSQPTCRAEGCDVPATWCEAHHWRPWAHGGSTDLKDGVLLCSHHHHRVHDPAFTATRLPTGRVRITRRT